tara:strand:+ start:879 stop:1070 length:192 start_codon:yes stop_codon:yes gene_type:complete
MHPSLLFALICSYAAVYLFGIFSGFMMEDRNKLKSEVREYQRQREKELRQKTNNWDHWDHPVY